MTAYLIRCETYMVAVTEISYEKETKEQLLGTKLVRNIVGNTYHISARLAKNSRNSRVEVSLETALQLAREKARQWQDSWRQAVQEIDAAMRAKA